MSDSSKISFRLSPALQAALAAHVGQGRRVSDILREALEAYLGVCPTDSPTAPPMPDIVSGAIEDLSGRVTTMARALADIQARLERLEARETPPAHVGQGPTVRPTPVDRAQAPPRGTRKLTPRQIRALRDKHRRGVPVPALMDEYQISRASVFRYLQSAKR
jgi:hypothetical protein